MTMISERRPTRTHRCSEQTELPTDHCFEDSSPALDSVHATICSMLPHSNKDGAAETLQIATYTHDL